jgi:hypothetical protein
MISKLLSMIGLKRQRSEKSIQTSLTRKKCKCPICCEYLISNITTKCGHSFCEDCLYRSLIYSPHCPLCRSKLGNSFFPCKAIDNLISAELSDSKKDYYDRRIKKCNDWKEARRLKSCKVGMKIDVLDDDGVWCVAIVKARIDNGDQFQYLQVRYIEPDKQKQEIISEGSNRLAPIGFFTSHSTIRFKIMNR